MAPVYLSVDYALFEFCNINILHYRQIMEPSRTLTVAADFLNSFEMNNIDDKWASEDGRSQGSQWIYTENRTYTENRIYTEESSFNRSNIE